jgi:tRNA U34 5-carboxymethylaminomethyl modifying GTPase MnmE/TrmE
MQFLRIHIECELRSELAYTILELESELEYPSETMEIQQQKQARESNKQLSNRHFARITTITQGKT